MPRMRLAVLGMSSISVAFSAGTVMADNVALPAVNPNVRVAATTTFGSVAATNNINNGADGGSADTSIFQVPNSTVPGIPPGSRGFGYDLGGVATVASLDLSQYSGGSPLGPRARLSDVMVHTSGGSFPFSLPDQEDVTLTFPSPVTTSWVMIEPVFQHFGNDPQIGIDELAVNTVAGGVLPGRANVALGAPATIQGPNWNNTNGNFTDNVLAAANTDLSTSSFNSSPTTPGVSIDLDLGSDFTINGLGLAENDYGGAGGRQLAQNVRLEFSDDPSFLTVNEFRDLTLENIPYQQEDFDPATGRYVRLTFQSTYPNPDSNLGFTEVQLFQVPEPAALGLVVAAMPLLLRRRR